MKIYFSGSQSTGKTTIFNEVKSLYRFRDYTKISNVIRDLSSNIGIQFNESGNDISQRIISSTYLHNHITNENLISDRCSWDAYVYSLWLYKKGKITKETYNFSKDLFEFTFKTTDVIFLTPIEFDIVEDGVRSTDNDFRKEINDIFMEMGPILRKVVPLSGSVQERLDMFINVMNHEFIPPEKFAVERIEEIKDLS